MYLVIDFYSHSLTTTTPTESETPAVSTQLHRGAIAHGIPPFRRRSVCSSCSPRAGHGGQVVVARGHGKAGYANYRHGADRCSMAGMGVGAGSLKILTGVLVHRVARPLRGSVSCGSGWSVPCVSIQLTLSQGPPSDTTAAWQCFVW